MKRFCILLCSLSTVKSFSFFIFLWQYLNLLYLQLKFFKNMLEVKVAFSTTKYIFKFEKILSYYIRINQKKICILASKLYEQKLLERLFKMESKLNPICPGKQLFVSRGNWCTKFDSSFEYMYYDEIYIEIKFRNISLNLLASELIFTKKWITNCICRTALCQQAI